jgi:dihydroorotase
MHAGTVSRELNLPGKSAASEDTIVARNCRLALDTGWRIHMQHLSSAGAVALVRQALARGAPVSAEVTPHNLALTDEACRRCGTNAKMNPPLRTELDRQALLAGLRDDSIGVIATDHAPHAAAEKAADFALAPFGVVGLESAVPVCLTLLYHGGILGLTQLVSKLTWGPKRVLGLAQGSIEHGAPADITVLNLNREFVLDATRFRSKARNCPFHGWTCRGKAVATMVAGEWVWSELAQVTARDER